MITYSFNLRKEINGIICIFVVLNTLLEIVSLIDRSITKRWSYYLHSESGLEQKQGLELSSPEIGEIDINL